MNYFLPFDKLVDATYEMKRIMDRHGIKVYVQQMFPEPHGSEHVSLMFHHPDDMVERAKVWDAMQEMMDRALELGGAPYSKGRQWGPHLQKHLQEHRLLAPAEGHQGHARSELHHEPGCHRAIALTAAAIPSR